MILEDTKESRESQEGKSLIAAVIRQAVQDLDIAPRKGKKKMEIEMIRQSARNFLRSEDAKVCAMALHIPMSKYQLLLARHGIHD